MAVSDVEFVAVGIRCNVIILQFWRILGFILVT